MFTPAQQAIVKADILANSDLNSKPNTCDGGYAIALLYNVAAVPDYWVWRTSVSKEECVSVPSTDADGVTVRNFIWTGNGFITRSVGEQTAWSDLFSGSDGANASRPNTRQGFADVFTGTGNAANNRTHLLNVFRRKATRLEKLLATGTGTPAAPALMTWEGAVTFSDVCLARNS